MRATVRSTDGIRSAIGYGRCRTAWLRTRTSDGKRIGLWEPARTRVTARVYGNACTAGPTGIARTTGAGGSARVRTSGTTPLSF